MYSFPIAEKLWCGLPSVPLYYCSLMTRFLPGLILLFALGFFFVTERRNYFVSEENGPETVTLWAWATPAETMNQLKAEFENEHPDLRLEIQTVPWTSLQQKTLWAVAANSNVPDVVVGSSEWTGALAASGALMPLDKHLEPAFFEAFFPATLGIYQFPEVRRDQPGAFGQVRQYGVPLDLDLMMIYYRADVIDPILNDLGIVDFPQDWESFELLGRTVAEPLPPDVPSRHLLYLDPDDPVPMRMAFLPASGGRILDEDFSRAVFDSPEAIEAFAFYDRLLSSGAAKRWSRGTMEDPIVLYKTDRTFANISGPWYSKFLASKAPEQAGKWRVALFPRRLPEFPTCGLGGACMAIPYNAPNPDAALKLIRFMSTPKFSLAYFARVGSPPPLKAAWNDPVFDAPQPYFGGQRIYRLVREAIETARPLQLLPNPELLKGPIHKAMYDITVQNAEVVPTLEEAVAEADQILAND